MSAYSLYRLPYQTLRVTGPDRATWLNGIATGDILAAQPEHAVWSLLLNKVGKIQADFSVLALGDALILGMTTGDAVAVQELLEKFLVMEDAEIAAADDLEWYLVLGDLPEGAESSLPPGEAWVTSTIKWGSQSALLLVGLSLHPEFRELVGSLPQASDEEWTAFRLKTKKPLLGVDFTEREKPHDAGLERLTVDWKKGCYLGQEVVCMQDMRGKARKRVVLLKSPETLTGLTAGLDVMNSEGKAVGKISSFSGNLAFASIRAPHEVPGNSLLVASHPVVVERLDA
jgi:folate-binding protein YgfZ